jgi:hypothetical protein
VCPFPSFVNAKEGAMAVTIINNAAQVRMQPDNSGKVQRARRENTRAKSKKKAGGKRKRESHDERLYRLLDRVKLFCKEHGRLPLGTSSSKKGQPTSDEGQLAQFIYNLRRRNKILEDREWVAYINAINPMILERKERKKKRKTIVSNDDRFQNNIDLLGEFFILRQRLPSVAASATREERKLGHFINDCRKFQRAGTLSDERKDAINAVHPGILSYNKTNSRKRKASSEWEEEFAKAASRTSIQQVRSCAYPSDGIPYVPVCSSNEEHMIRETGACFKFQPSDCHPETTSQSTLQDVMSYALHPERRKRDYEGGDTIPTFIPNVVNIDRKRGPNHRSGSLFPSDNVPSHIKQLMSQVEDLLMPNNLIGRIQSCRNLDEFDVIMKEEEHLFDTFNYGDKGLSYKKVVNIFDTHFPQPRRQSYSTYAEPPIRCPSILDENGEAVHLQELFRYGATGRPILDTRCRPMNNLLYNLGVEAWKHVREQLSPLSQVCPPNACVGMMYSWVKSEGEEKDMKSEMRPHHDNRHKPNTNEAIGANNEEDSNSHMHGSDVIMLTFGDEMEYQLIPPTHRNGQTYAKMSQENAIDNRTAGFMKTMPLGNGTIYVHTCDDDDLYFHALRFTGDFVRSRVRFALVFRWLTKPAYFRQSAADHRGHRYSMIDKKAIEDVDKMPKKAQMWWRAMHYLDDNGNNTLRQLMDPVEE